MRFQFAAKARQKAGKVGDFFGIIDTGRKDIAGQKIKGDSCGLVTERYKPLLQSRVKFQNQEALKNTSFGTIRYDAENIPKSHGQFEPDNEKPQYSTIDIKKLYQVDTNQGEDEVTKDDSDYINIEEHMSLDQVLGAFQSTPGFINRLPKPSTEDGYRLDSKGFRDYSLQVQNWNLISKVDMINHLQSSIIYNNYDIIAINKPYGLASHNEINGDSKDVNSLMQEVGRRLRFDKLYLAHRLDKTATGVLIFASSPEMAAKLNKQFKSDQIQKTYWCITAGVPNPEHAIIDIPIGELNISGIIRSCIYPEDLEKEYQISSNYRQAVRAITEYRVLEKVGSAALLEVRPRTGVKHQIRCHLAFGLMKPILGDHKYSHIAKVAPQRLPQPILNALRLRQPKVRTLPLHLHAKTVVIPGAKANGQTLFIHAPLPSHFVQNMRSLGLHTDPVSL